MVFGVLQERAAKLKADGQGFGYGRAVRRLGATVAVLEEDMDKLEKVFPQVCPKLCAPPYNPCIRGFK